MFLSLSKIEIRTWYIEETMMNKFSKYYTEINMNKVISIT